MRNDYSLKFIVSTRLDEFILVLSLTDNQHRKIDLNL